MQQLGNDTQVDGIIEQLQAALSKWYRGDLLAYADLFAEDVTYFDLMATTRIEGLERLRQHYAPFQGKVHVPRFEIVAPKLRSFGDKVVLLTYRLHEFMTDGPPSRAFHTTEVYRLDPEGWRIVHAHWSAAP